MPFRVDADAQCQPCVLQFVRQLLERNNVIIAGVRKPDASEELRKLKAGNSKALSIVPLDVTDVHSIGAWADQVGESCKSVDVRNCMAELLHIRIHIVRSRCC